MNLDLRRRAQSPRPKRSTGVFISDCILVVVMVALFFWPAVLWWMSVWP